MSKSLTNRPQYVTFITPMAYFFYDQTLTLLSNAVGKLSSSMMLPSMISV